MPRIRIMVNGIAMSSDDDYEKCDKCDEHGRLPAVEGPGGGSYKPFCACKWGMAQRELNK